MLARGIAEDVDPLTWLHGRIWPFESSMTEEDSYTSTLLRWATCFAESGGQHVSGMAETVEALGLRARLARSVMDCGEGLPVAWASETAQDCIEVGTVFKGITNRLIQSHWELFRRCQNTADGRIRVWLGIRQIMNCTDELLLATRDLNTGIHMHVAEIPYENKVVVNTRNDDHGTVTYPEKMDFLQSNLLSDHTVWVYNAETGFLSRAGVKVSHCPAAAMKMLGFAPIKEMLLAGICVSLGTDGAPSNNRMSMDMILINPYLWSMVPLHDRVSGLVYSMRAKNIISEMCNGPWIMKDGKILTVH